MTDGPTTLLNGALPEQAANRRQTVAKTWTDMVDEAKALVTGVSPAEAHQRLQDDPEALLIEGGTPNRFRSAKGLQIW